PRRPGAVAGLAPVPAAGPPNRAGAGAHRVGRDDAGLRDGGGRVAPRPRGREGGARGRGGRVTRRAESLAALQERFWRLISAPEPVARALPQVTATDPGAAPLSGWIRAASEGAAAARLDVYANMYFFRLLGVLRDDYPNLARLVGADAFHNLITDYLVAFPSRHPSIRHVGANLAELLDRHPLERRFPGAADLARLEWARGLAFDRADARALTADELTAVPPERWGELRFQLVPSFQMLRLGRPVHRLWQALERGEGGSA